jgi:hypothetical protein
MDPIRAAHAALTADRVHLNQVRGQRGPLVFVCWPDRPGAREYLGLVRGQSGPLWAGSVTDSQMLESSLVPAHDEALGLSSCWVTALAGWLALCTEVLSWWEDLVLPGLPSRATPLRSYGRYCVDKWLAEATTFSVYRGTEEEVVGIRAAVAARLDPYLGQDSPRPLPMVDPASNAVEASVASRGRAVLESLAVAHTLNVLHEQIADLRRRRADAAGAIRVSGYSSPTTCRTAPGSVEYSGTTAAQGSQHSDSDWEETALVLPLFSEVASGVDLRPRGVCSVAARHLYGDPPEAELVQASITKADLGNLVFTRLMAQEIVMRDVKGGGDGD